MKREIYLAFTDKGTEKTPERLTVVRAQIRRMRADRRRSREFSEMWDLTSAVADLLIEERQIAHALGR